MLHSLFIMTALLFGCMGQTALPQCSDFRLLSSGDFPTPPGAYCEVDDGSADDQPGQKDLNQFCRQPSVGSYVNFSFSFDDVNFRSQTGYGCLLIGNAANPGKPAYAVCVSVTGSVVHYKTEVFGCQQPNAFTQRCTPVNAVSSPKTCCNVKALNVDPFSAHQLNGGGKGLDTAVLCQVYLPEVGSENAYLLNACSYASGSGSSPGDCIRSVECSSTVPCGGATQCQTVTCVSDTCVYSKKPDGTSCTATANNGDCDAASDECQSGVCVDKFKAANSECGSQLGCSPGRCSGTSATCAYNANPALCKCSCDTAPCIARTCVGASSSTMNDGCTYKVGSLSLLDYASIASAGCSCPA